MTYADTSGLVKGILDAAGSDEMRALIEGEEIIASAVTGYVELRAALAAAVSAHRLSGNDPPAVLAGELWARLAEVPIDDELIRRAGDFAERFSLRGYDAVHLAGLVRTGPPGVVTLASRDTDLRRAAAELGYSLFPR